MTRPAYHGRTHSRDGTDPIPGLNVVDSIDGTGGPLTGDVTLSAGAGIALTQVLQNIEIAALAAQLDYFVAYQPNVEDGTFGVSPDWEAIYGYNTNVFGTLPVTIGGTGFDPTLRGPHAASPTRNSEIRLPLGRWLVIFGVNPDPSAPTNSQNVPRLYAGANFSGGVPIAAPVWRVAEQTSESPNNKSFAVAVANFGASSRAIEANIGSPTFAVGNNTPTAFDDERNVGCVLICVKLSA